MSGSIQTEIKRLEIEIHRFGRRLIDDGASEELVVQAIVHLGLVLLIETGRKQPDSGQSLFQLYLYDFFSLIGAKPEETRKDRGKNVVH